MADDNIRFADFSVSPEPIIMRIAPDEFRLYPEIPLDTMMDIVKYARGAKDKSSTQDEMAQLLELVSGAMEPNDYDKFVQRTKKPTRENPNPNPIGLQVIRKILPWFMEVYGLRPTPASSESASGSDDANTSSTEPASDETSTS